MGLIFFAGAFNAPLERVGRTLGDRPPISGRPGVPGRAARAGNPAPGLHAGRRALAFPPSPHPLIWADSEIRLHHAAGQGLPDRIARRSGRIHGPDGMAFPETHEEVRALLAYAEMVGAQVVVDVL